MFHFRTIRWRIAFSYVVLLLLAMAGLTLYLTGQARSIFLDELRRQLSTEAALISGSTDLQSHWSSGPAGLVPLVEDWARLLDARVTVVALDGTVLADSHVDYRRMENHGQRPEIQAALSQGRGSLIRFSESVGAETLYAAVQIAAGDELPVLGVLRLALSLDQVRATTDRLRDTIVVTTLIISLFVILLAVVIADRTVAPVHHLTQIAEQMAGGDLSVRSWPTSQDEVGQLSRSFNRMVDALEEQMTSLTKEQERLAAVLNNMADGVLIVDRDGYVQLVNPRAAHLLETTAAAALGYSFAQVVRDHRIVELWQRCRKANVEQVEAIELDRGRLLQAVVTPFWDASRHSYLVILQDLTQIRRLETVRQDFISNISHELRTPLASLRALVETLRDGALDDPPAARRFLDRVEIEVDALTQMVQELLELYRIESGRVPLRLQPTPVGEIVLGPIERLSAQAERAGVALTVDLPGDLPPALADAERVRQVVTNLIHNAIKFTPAGGSIAVRAWVDESRPAGTQDQAPRRPVSPVASLLLASQPAAEIVVAVADTGTGIPLDDLPRIFERFFKTDRSRAGGGTGLGLAIAKHVVQAHEGRIWVESVEGEGSTFFFTLPLAGDRDR